MGLRGTVDRVPKGRCEVRREKPPVVGPVSFLVGDLVSFGERPFGTPARVLEVNGATMVLADLTDGEIDPVEPFTVERVGRLWRDLTPGVDDTPSPIYSEEGSK